MKKAYIKKWKEDPRHLVMRIPVKALPGKVVEAEKKMEQPKPQPIVIDLCSSSSTSSEEQVAAAAAHAEPTFLSEREAEHLDGLVAEFGETVSKRVLTRDFTLKPKERNALKHVEGTTRFSTREAFLAELKFWGNFDNYLCGVREKRDRQATRAQKKRTRENTLVALQELKDELRRMAGKHSPAEEEEEEAERTSSPKKSKSDCGGYERERMNYFETRLSENGLASYDTLLIHFKGGKKTFHNGESKFGIKKVINWLKGTHDFVEGAEIVADFIENLQMTIDNRSTSTRHIFLAPPVTEEKEEEEEAEVTPMDREEDSERTRLAYLSASHRMPIRWAQERTDDDEEERVTPILTAADLWDPDAIGPFHLD